MVKDVRDIERVALTHVDDVEAQLRGQVLAEAEKNFGYCADAFEVAGPLAKALVELGIAPLKTEQVKAYKKSKEREELHSPGFTALACCVAALSVVAVLLALFWRMVPALIRPETQWKAIGISSVAFVAGVAASVMIIGMITEYEQTKIKWSWKSYHLSNQNSPRYERYVPIYALNYANQIKQLLPKASFVVDELHCEEVPMPDPFLSVRLGSEHYYIAVWDEREFEAKM